MFLLDLRQLLLWNVIWLNFKLMNFFVNCKVCLVTFLENRLALFVISQETCASWKQVHIQMFIVRIVSYLVSECLRFGFEVINVDQQSIHSGFEFSHRTFKLSLCVFSIIIVLFVLSDLCDEVVLLLPRTRLEGIVVPLQFVHLVLNG